MDPNVAAAPCKIFPNTRFPSRDSTAIELRTGKDLATLNRNRVFDPNGITQTLGPLDTRTIGRTRWSRCGLLSGAIPCIPKKQTELDSCVEDHVNGERPPIE